MSYCLMLHIAGVLKKFYREDRPSDLTLNSLNSSTIILTCCWQSFKSGIWFFVGAIRVFSLDPKESKCLIQSFNVPHFYSFKSRSLTFT